MCRLTPYLDPPPRPHLLSAPAVALRSSWLQVPGRIPLRLRAMAAVEGVDIVSINMGARRGSTAQLSDLVQLYPGEAKRSQPRTRSASASAQFVYVQMRSWALDVVPRLTRQQAGQLMEGEREVRVIVYNGKDHYNATCQYS